MIKKINITMLIVLTFYIFLTLSNPFFYNFNNDEILSWNTVQSLGMIDIIRLMRTAGHTFIWYLIIKPLTYFNNIFAIKIVNWIFAFSAVSIMWLFAPFNKIIKILITFSTPFLCIYPVIARCYSIGIFFLFLIAINYKNRLKKPYLFSFLIFLAANTSLMAAIPTLIIGVIFGFDILKSKKNYNSLLVLILAPITLFLQWYKPVIPTYAVDYIFSERAITIFFDFYKFQIANILSFVIYPLVLIASILYFKNNIRVFLFLTLSVLTLLIVFNFVYCGFDYHFYFFYIYLIMAFWIHNEHGNFKNFFIIMFILLSLLLCAKRVSHDWLFKANYSEITACINSFIEKESSIYTTLFHSAVLIPYLNNSKLLDYNGEKLTSYKNFKTMYYIYPELDINNLIKNASDNSYLLITRKELNKTDANIDFSDRNRFRGCHDFLIYKLK